MALNKSSSDDVLVLDEALLDDELEAAVLALASSLLEIDPSPSLSRALSIFSAMRSAIFLRNSVKSTELAWLLILETDMGFLLGWVESVMSGFVTCADGLA
jgi:hypothetical protein